MKDLKAMAATEAQGLLQEAHNALIDIAQHCRNKYTDGEKMAPEIEVRFSEAFWKLQKGRSWVQALERA